MSEHYRDYIPTPAANEAMKAISTILGEGYKRSKLSHAEQRDVDCINCDLLTARMPGLTGSSRDRAKLAIVSLSTGTAFRGLA